MRLLRRSEGNQAETDGGIMQDATRKRRSQTRGNLRHNSADFGVCLIALGGRGLTVGDGLILLSSLLIPGLGGAGGGKSHLWGGRLRLFSE